MTSNSNSLPAPVSDMTEALSRAALKAALLQAFAFSKEKGGLVGWSDAEVKLVETDLTFPADKCCISGYKPAPNGYAQIRYRGVKYYAHRIAALEHWYQWGRIKAKLPAGWEASHWRTQLSCSKLCYNPLHLWPELPSWNKGREFCRLAASSPGYLCPHDGPTCVDCFAASDWPVYACLLAQAEGSVCTHQPPCEVDDDADS